MLRIFALILILSNLAASEEVEQHFDYTHTIKEVKPHKEEGGKTVYWIELYDGSIWRWSVDNCCEHLLRKWEKGDEIWLRNSDQTGFLLYNCSKPRFVPPVTLVSKSHTKLLTIDELSLDGRYLMLSDGSEWRLVFDYQAAITREWEIGDLIFPTKCPYDGYELVNLDMPYDPRRPNHRHVNALLQNAPNITFRPVKKESQDFASREQ